MNDLQREEFRRDIDVANQARQIVECAYDPPTTRQTSQDVVDAANTYLLAFFKKYLMGLNATNQN